MMTMIEKMLSKISSGRYILTLAAAYVFVWMVMASKMSAEAAAGIVSTVFALYFTRTDRTGDTNGKSV